MRPRGFVVDTLGLAASQYLARAVVLARGLLAAAALGPAGYGGWNALNLFLDYGGYATAGVVQGLDLKLPAAVRLGDRPMARRLLAGAWFLALGVGLLFAAALVVAIAGGRLPILAAVGPVALASMLVAVLLQLAIQVHASALRAQGRFATVSAATAAQAVVGGGLGILLMVRHGVAGLMGGWALGTLLGFLWLRASRPGVPLLPGAPGTGGALARIGFPVFAFFAASLLLRSVDRLALIRYAESATLGTYGLGVLAAGLVLYVPESAAAVLYPRVAAAAHGAVDAARTRLDLVRAHRSFAVLLPLAVGVMMVWAGPLVARLLPAYQDGVPVFRVLAIGSLMLSASTLPGYYLIGSGHGVRALAIGLLSAALTWVVVFAIAARDPRPVPVAVGASAGYAAFAIGMVALAARVLFDDPRGRAGFVWASFVPALWTGGVAWAACRIGADVDLRSALARTGVVMAGHVPVLWAFGRGVGLRRLARDWIRVRLPAV